MKSSYNNVHWLPIARDFSVQVSAISIGLRGEWNVTCYGFAASSGNRDARFRRDFCGGEGGKKRGTVTRVENRNLAAICDGGYHEKAI